MDMLIASAASLLPIGPSVDNNQQNFFHKNELLAEYRNRQAGGALDFGYQPSRDSDCLK